MSTLGAELQSRNEQIRKNYQEGKTPAELATLYKMSAANVYLILGDTKKRPRRSRTMTTERTTEPADPLDPRSSGQKLLSGLHVDVLVRVNGEAMTLDQFFTLANRIGRTAERLKQFGPGGGT